MQYPQAIINLDALDNNIQTIRRLRPGNRILAILKANAYGHDAILLAKLIAHKVDGIGTARVEEAVALRKAGITNKIVVLEGFLGYDELLQIQKYKLDTVIHCFEQVALVEKYQHELTHLHTWLKFNTGMHRLGFDIEELLEAQSRIEATSCFGIMTFITHLSRADDEKELEFTLSQFKNFSQVREAFDHYDYSISASAGILFHKPYPGDWIRPGIILYGVSPSPNYSIADKGFEPVLSLETKLISVHARKAGDTIGYGGIYTLPEDTNIGVIGIGYGDGYPRCAPAGTPVYINGRIVPIVGRVSMDMITVDLGKDCQDKVGDRVVVFGKENPVEDVARHIQLSTYELTTSITGRVTHIVKS